MLKTIVYGSHLCPECVELKDYLTKKEVEFTYFDISLELGALKRFLKIRDNSNLFEEVRQYGAIGVPTVLINDEVIVGFDKDKIEELLK